MAGRLKAVKLDHAGMEAVLKSDGVSEELKGLAERVAGAVNLPPHAHHLKVQIRDGETDRATYQVALAHPSGLAHEAKYGMLAKAAAEVGLEVSDRGTRAPAKTSTRKRDAQGRFIKNG